MASVSAKVRAGGFSQSTAIPRSAAASTKGNPKLRRRADADGLRLKLFEHGHAVGEGLPAVLGDFRPRGFSVNIGDADDLAAFRMRRVSAQMRPGDPARADPVVPFDV